MTERLARIVWYWSLRSMRRAPIRRVNHKIAARLSTEHGKRFLARGKRQNAWARKHAVTLIKWSLNVFFFILLCLLLDSLCEWLLAHGYFNAPGSPQRNVTPP